MFLGKDCKRGGTCSSKWLEFAKKSLHRSVRDRRKETIIRSHRNNS